MTDDSELRIAGVLLAAGASSRMGRNKMLVEIDGEAIVHRAARRALGAGLSPLIVVLGHEVEEVRHALHDLPCHFAFNPSFHESTSSSLHRGIELLPTEVDGLVVMLADMVAVTTEMIRALIIKGRGSNAPLVASRYDDVNAPPLLFRRELFAELLAWHGEGCGKAVVQRHRAQAVYLDWERDLLIDLDTPADLIEYLGRGRG